MLTLTKPLTLASNSPRRKQLLKEAGYEFDIEVIPTDETYPDNLPIVEIAGFVSCQKAEMFRGKSNDRLILTADTVVIHDHQILAKPTDRQDAIRMLRLLSGTSHQVVTAVSLLSNGELSTVYDIALVYFKKLAQMEIDYYIEHYKPYDKAGSYGIQEWIGMVGVEKIEGSFYTIMGLPVHLVYQLLMPFQNHLNE